MFAYLKFLTVGPTRSVASARHFRERIKHKKLEPDESMVSSISQQLAIDAVIQFLTEHYGERDKPLNTEQLLKLMRYCFKTYFIFGGQMYEQIKGTPIAPPLSDLIAEVVLQRIEHLVFRKY
ncbi:unnamed protein product [Dibothriocephalus latus]|uniref:Uncharacterized protein n=1 Tax=Dibothriocephalus latus TaxID=60516 RepID=A0A3P7P2N3_DIBLA|nr:unnamed protein product [Dibothriocephalus latus]